MSTLPARASNGSQPGINDDIGEEMRLTMYRTQVVLREAEQRAYDLFLQNLVKGTSHLSLGQDRELRCSSGHRPRMSGATT